LRAPLRHIGGFADMLREECKSALDDAGRRYLDVISDSVAHMGRLIDDLLTFSRMGRVELRKTTIRMDRLVDEVLQQLAADANGRNIEWDIHPLPEVPGDPSMLRQVWMNLLSNALKYTRRRDRARITVACDSRDGEFEFSVQDNGVGFDPKYADKLFGVFQRLHRSEEFEGTGVGLANVQRIVSRHGGRTRAVGETDRGATFYFTLPASATEQT
jgi:light-regulated signal transduction histidine kinase (bacteriophytochrome)